MKNKGKGKDIKLNTSVKLDADIIETHEMAFTPVTKSRTNSFAMGPNARRPSILKANSGGDLLRKSNELLAMKKARSATFSTPNETSNLLKEQLTSSPSQSRYSQASHRQSLISHRQSVASIAAVPTPLPRNIEMLEIIATLLLSRTIYIPIAETAIISFNSIIHFILVYLEFSTAIQMLLHTYEDIAIKSLDYLYTLLRYIILFGLGWTAPSCFSTVGNTLSNFTFFLLAARFVYFVRGLALAKTFTKDFSFADSYFITASISLIPIAPWIICIFLTNFSQSYTSFWIGTLIDIAIIITGDVVKLAFIPALYGELPPTYLAIWQERWKFSLTSIAGIGIFHLVENNMMVGFPELYTSVKFNIVHYIWTLAALSMIYSFRTLHQIAIKDDKPHISLIKGSIALVILKWIHVVIGLLFMLTISLLKISTSDLNSSQMQRFYLPMNMTVFGIDSMQITEAVGLNYLAEFTSLIGAPRILSSAFYLQVLMGCSGMYLICLAAVNKLLRILEDGDPDPYFLYTLATVGAAFLMNSSSFILSRTRISIFSNFLNMLATFDLQRLGENKDLDELRVALRDVGFIYIKNHKIPNELIDQYFDKVQKRSSKSKEFFAKPVEEKLQHKYIPNTNAGWLKMGSEKINQKSGKTEIKEALNIRKDRIDSMDNELIDKFIKECHRVCVELLVAYAACLNIESSAGGNLYFANRHRYAQSSGDVLRSLYYPACEGQDISHTIRADGHSDFGSITLLFLEKSDPGGLEIVQANTKDIFIPVEQQDDCVIVNTGDLMEYWTGSYFRSTIHRVTIPSNRSKPRYSIAYFCHAEDSTTLDKVDSAILNENIQIIERSSNTFEDYSATKLYGKPKTAAEHLELRLKHIHSHENSSGMELQ
ncbi:hypothetical protein HDV06_003208 [Boothiomyces sp. JEL0866]|nr:hypothetical protein HDV06_003208 [Boothiomyces sp. JEL0866]